VENMKGCVVCFEFDEREGGKIDGLVMFVL
jgi:hypothetical protein